MTVRKEILVPQIKEPYSHYTDVVQFGDLVFMSGAGPLDLEGNIVGGDDVIEQTRQVLRNIEHMLTAVGATFADVAKVTVYCTDPQKDILDINVARKEFFGDSRPVSTLIGVKEFAAPGMKVEIDAIAVLSSQQ